MRLLREIRSRIGSALNARRLHDETVRERSGELDQSGKGVPGVRNEDIVWVLGGGRTGSSWLATMLAEAFDSTLWFEPRLGSLFDPDWMSSQGGRGYVFDPEHESSWLPAIRNFVLTAGGLRFPEARGFVIKETGGSKAASTLLKAFPGSKLVLLVRDPRDVVASWNDAYTEGGWRDRQMRRKGGGNPLERLGKDTHSRRRAEHFVSSIEPALDTFELYTGSKSFVTYEELRADTRRVLERIATDLHLSKERVQKTAEAHSFEAIPERKRGAGKFYRKASPGGWREDLTPAQVEIVEEVTASLMQRLGYERVSS